MLSGNSLRQTVHTHRAFVHRAAKLVAALLKVARVTAGLSWLLLSLLFYTPGSKDQIEGAVEAAGHVIIAR